MKHFILSILLIISTLSALADVISKPNTERLVNDFAGLLSESQISFLEDSLSRYARRTSTQIVVVTTSDLGGYSPSDYAYRIGETWGIGQRGKNNGVVILVKPKLKETDKGQAFIASGYGLEAALPDITCTRIVRNDMIPHFKQNNYPQGIMAGAVSVMKACEGEYEGEPINDDDEGVGIVAIIIIIIVLYIALKNDKNAPKGKKNSRMSSGNGLSEAILISNLLRHSSSSNWGSFSGGSGSFGGGFGGFGGGSFGGGGGGGSW